SWSVRLITSHTARATSGGQTEVVGWPATATGRAVPKNRPLCSRAMKSVRARAAGRWSAILMAAFARPMGLVTAPGILFHWRIAPGGRVARSTGQRATLTE
ncbi:MAG: hypothetical protein ACREMY_28035, partial [bacterium]